ASNSTWGVVGETFLPYAWADEHLAYSDEDAEDFKDAVYGAQDMAGEAALWAAVAAAGMFAGVVGLVGYRRRVRRELTDALLEKKGGGGRNEEEEWDITDPNRQERSNTITF
ncbi:hypothetical protein TrRE_jg4685, partial [Triparma retinervis]